MTSSGTRYWELALLDVDAKNQATAGAVELGLEPFVGRWGFPAAQDTVQRLTDCLHPFFLPFFY